MVEEVDPAVVERIGQAVTGPVDREDVVVLSEGGEDRHHLEGTAQPAVDVQQRCATAELEDLRLAPGPANPSHASLGRESGEQGGLRPLHLSVQLRLHENPGSLRATRTASVGIPIRLRISVSARGARTRPPPLCSEDTASPGCVRHDARPFAG